MGAAVERNNHIRVLDDQDGDRDALKFLSEAVACREQALFLLHARLRSPHLIQLGREFRGEQRREPDFAEIQASLTFTGTGETTMSDPVVIPDVATEPHPVVHPGPKPGLEETAPRPEAPGPTGERDDPSSGQGDAKEA